ncbi:MAG: chemotaxis protein CheW [Proteobacteria bacterium]|nr:chemotaxis protein CheW [Pseudomonadota bacterium]
MNTSTESGVSDAVAEDNNGEQLEYVTLTIGGQWFGIPVLSVRDVLGPQNIAMIPLAPPEVAGSLNLRGRIVTAIDPRVRLGLPKREENETVMSIVVEHLGELYSLLIDQVGEVLKLPSNRFEHNPASLDPRWREISTGIYRLDDRLVIVIDIERLLNFGTTLAA